MLSGMIRQADLRDTALAGGGATRTMALLGAALALSLATPAAAQQVPLGLRTAEGLTVTPAFEGWYENGDGTYTLSFGYFNRNFEEVLEIPVGPGNYIAPAGFDGGQPTRFEPRRHWGVFGVVVPGDFPEEGEVRWTLVVRGDTLSVPGHLKTEWQIDALAGEAGSGNTPPVLRFAEDGPEGAGPLGISTGPIEATVGEPFLMTVWARDDGAPSTSVASPGSEDEPVTLTWFKHRGPGEVTFVEASTQVPVEGGQMTIEATFSQPGEYVLRVRANDASGVTGAGHAQCCWTNGFVTVRVTG